MLDLTEGTAQLTELLKRDKLIIFAGSGMSVPSGLPTWEGFLEQFIAFCEELTENYKKHGIDKIFTKNLFIDARKNKTRYPGQVATVLKGKFKELPNRLHTNVKDEYMDWFTRCFGPFAPNPYHELIVKSKFPYILTSNYDLLFEAAAKSTGKLYSSLSFHENTALAEALYIDDPAIIHIHGKYNNVRMDNVIFTSDDYFNIIKKRYPAFSFAMHSLLTRYSTLFVGYGASDPHLEDLVEEFAQYFDYKDGYDLPKNYLVLPKGKADLVKKEFKKKMGTSIILIDNYDDYNVLLTELSRV